MANFTLKVETAASKAKVNPPKKDPLFYILPPLIVAAVLAVVYNVQPPKQAEAPLPAAEAPATTTETETTGEVGLDDAESDTATE